MANATPPRHPLYRELAIALAALDVCTGLKANHVQLACTPRWEAFIRRAERELPRGSGFDVYPTVDLEASTPNKIIITGSFHKMNDGGMYDGYADYRITVRPDLALGFTLTVSGITRGEFQDFVAECFHAALGALCAPGAFHAAADVAQGVTSHA